MRISLYKNHDRIDDQEPEWLVSVKINNEFIILGNGTTKTAENGKKSWIEQELDDHVLIDKLREVDFTKKTPKVAEFVSEKVQEYNETQYPGLYPKEEKKDLFDII